MAPSGSGSLRDRKTGRWPLSLLAGTRAKTLAALAYTGGPCLEAVPTPPARRACLIFGNFLTRKCWFVYPMRT
jgi:hypothetical protein